MFAGAWAVDDAIDHPPIKGFVPIRWRGAVAPVHGQVWGAHYISPSPPLPDIFPVPRGCLTCWLDRGRGGGEISKPRHTFRRVDFFGGTPTPPLHHSMLSFLSYIWSCCPAKQHIDPMSGCINAKIFLC